MAIGTTVFPTGQGMAATFSTQLMERVGQVIGKEVRLQGGHISYGPVMDLTRDPRWSRVEEPGTFLLMVGPASDNILLQETIQFTIHN